MDKIGFFEEKENVDFDYDEEADVLYLSIGKPRKAMSMDVGEGTIIRYDEDTKEVVGVTLIGLRNRFLKQLKKVA